MEEVLCKDCAKCYYCKTWRYDNNYITPDKRIYLCECEKVEGKFDFLGHPWTKGNLGKINDCTFFIPQARVERPKMVVSEIKIEHKCPYCGHEDVSVVNQLKGDKLIVCKECDKSYSIWWDTFLEDCI